MFLGWSRHGVLRKSAAIGAAAIAFILLSIAALTVSGIQMTRSRVDSASRANAVSDAYEQTISAIALAKINFDQYRATGDPAQRQEFLLALQAALSQGAQIKAIGSEADRALVAAIEAKYGAELASAVQVLEDPATLDFQDWPVADATLLDRVMAEFAAPAEERRAQAAADLADFQGAIERRSQGILLAFAFGIPLLGVTILAIRRYELDDAAKTSELQRLEQAALTDALTGLGNHRAYQEELLRELAHSARSGRSLSVAILDIDNFKEVNDSRGHAAGDLVLGEFAKLATYVRSLDRVYRIGGDEFALIMAEAASDKALVALERLRSAVESGLKPLTISGGVASTESSGYEAEVLNSHADAALYEAKRSGKNRVSAFQQTGKNARVVTHFGTNSLRQLIARGSVPMVFQPILNHQNHAVIGLEALMRPPPECPFASPEEAFQVALRTGSIAALDSVCVNSALRAAPELVPGARLFLNLDPLTLTNASFSSADLAATVRAAGLAPSDIVLEITEKTIAPMEPLISRIRELRRLEFLVALDDVGSGNSGLEMLRLVKFDFVKIDRSVIVDAYYRQSGRAVVLAIVAFARETGAFVIAEGIDSTDLLNSLTIDENWLPGLSIQGVQGFLFGLPSGRYAASKNRGRAMSIGA